ncbi:MAG TPA: hypothetical protein VGL62_02650 [Vicinamibacterales bacterium]
MIARRSVCKRLPQLWLKPDGLDRRRRCTKRRAPSASAQRLIDVVSSLGPLGELRHELVGHRHA